MAHLVAQGGDPPPPVRMGSWLVHALTAAASLLLEFRSVPRSGLAEWSKSLWKGFSSLIKRDTLGNYCSSPLAVHRLISVWCLQLCLGTLGTEMASSWGWEWCIVDQGFFCVWKNLLLKSLLIIAKNSWPIFPHSLHGPGPAQSLYHCLCITSQAWVPHGWQGISQGQ